ncbi:hypothetical protein [Rhizobium sp. GCM10022189]|uniref:hypothetical protein n=1 Tax=Rhizobium sp. GCM10022189 TaxID=3252654 RepID=UPI00360F82ED
MKLHFTNADLKEAIRNSPDFTVEAGVEIINAGPFLSVAKAREGAFGKKKAVSRDRTLLGSFLLNARRREKLSYAAMAKRLGVDSVELKRVETEPMFAPALDFIESVARFVNIPTFEAQRLATGKPRDRERAIGVATRNLIKEAKSKAAGSSKPRGTANKLTRG